MRYTQGILIAALLALIICPAAQAAEVGTGRDEEDNIAFTFDNEPSIKIKEAGNEMSGLGCGVKSEGALRYNKGIKNVEVCNGSNWAIVGSAPNATAAANAACNAKFMGITRYNQSLATMEYCNGANWKTMNTKKIAVDYPTCKAAMRDDHGGSLVNYYAPFGAPTWANVNIACEKDYVIVGNDSKYTGGDTLVDAYCCKLKVTD